MAIEAKLVVEFRDEESDIRGDEPHEAIQSFASREVMLDDAWGGLESTWTGGCELTVIGMTLEETLRVVKDIFPSDSTRLVDAHVKTYKYTTPYAPLNMTQEVMPPPPSPVKFNSWVDIPWRGDRVWPKTGDMAPENVLDPMIVWNVHEHGTEVMFESDTEMCQTFTVTGPLWVARKVA